MFPCIYLICTTSVVCIQCTCSLLYLHIHTQIQKVNLNKQNVQKAQRSKGATFVARQKAKAKVALPHIVYSRQGLKLMEYFIFIKAPIHLLHFWWRMCFKTHLWWVQKQWWHICNRALKWLSGMAENQLTVL